jgi:hypothetical protein
MNIQEFRQQHPDYNDMSDSELTDRLYKKHYSDIDRKEFEEKFIGSPQTQPAAQDPGFLSRTGQDIKQRWQKMQEVSQQGTSAEKSYRVLGQEAGVATDILGEIGKSVYRALPENFRENVSSVSKGGMNLFPKDRLQEMGEGVEALQTGWKEFSKNNPNVAQDVEATFNLGTAGVGGFATKLVGRGVAPYARAAGEIAKGAVSTAKDISAQIFKGTERIDKAIAEEVKTTLPQAITPSQKNLKTAATTGKGESYFDQAVAPIKDTVENKMAVDAKGNQIYEYLDKKGNITNIPQSVADHYDAIKKGKDKWWREAVRLRQEATVEGGTMPVKPILEELQRAKIKRIDSNLPGKSADLAHIDEYIANLSRYEKTGLNLDQAQQELSALNEKLFGKGVQTGYEQTGIREIDSYVASKYREGMNNFVDSYHGNNKFEEAKKMYGSYKMQEEDTFNKMNRLAKQAPYSMFDISDIWIGYHTFGSILSGDIVHLTAAMGAEAAKKFMTYRNSADATIRRMYGKIDKLTDVKKRIADPQSTAGKVLQQARGEAERKQMTISGKNEPSSLVDTAGLKPSKVAEERGELTDFYEQEKQRIKDKKTELLRNAEYSTEKGQE